MQRNAIAITRSYRLLNIHLRRTGFYIFLLRNIFKLLFTLTLFLVFLLVLENYITDIKLLVQQSIGRINSFLVFGMYYISQSLMGFLPTNIFIIWIKTFKHPAAMLLVLSLISYAGGITAYLIGYYAKNSRIVQKLLKNRRNGIIEKTDKWGGLLIMMSAFLPLPFSFICLISGIVRFPLPSFLFWSLARIPKFFIMAMALNLVL